MGELYSNLAKACFNPIELTMSNMQGTNNRLRSIRVLGLRAARFPIKWTHVIGKVSLKTESWRRSFSEKAVNYSPALRAPRLMSQPANGRCRAKTKPSIDDPMLPIPFPASSAKGRGKSFPIGTSTEGQAMMNSDTERTLARRWRLFFANDS